MASCKTQNGFSSTPPSTTTSFITKNYNHSNKNNNGTITQAARWILGHQAKVPKCGNTRGSTPSAATCTVLNSNKHACFYVC